MKRWFLLTALLAAQADREARPCAPAPPPGAVVEIVEEEALILWEPSEKRQTFIRRATFDSSAKDFGFLVPTPAKPELSEASNELFTNLAMIIERPVRTEKKGLRFEPTALVLLPFMLTMRGGAPKSAVRILEEKRVAGYDATVLEADDPGALATWLADRGYSRRPELAAWLAPYVEAKWKLTAFKVAREETSRVGTSAVRMTFETERPFFPYREPEDQRTHAKQPRTLRVHLLAPTKMNGALEHTPDGANRWPGELQYAVPLDPLHADLLAGAGLKPEPGTWLNTWIDRSTPRPGTTELYFDAAEDQTPRPADPVIHHEPTEVPLPLDVPAAILLGIWIVRRRRRV